MSHVLHLEYYFRLGKIMKRILSFVALCALLANTAQAAVIISEDFEDNTVLFTASNGLFHDGGSDYFTIVPLNGPANSVSPYSGFAGTGFFAAEDIDDGNSRPTTQTLSFNVDITGFENLTFDTLFAAGGNFPGGAINPAYDSNDGFLVRAQVDAGPVQNLLSFESTGTTNTQTRRDTNFDGTGDGFTPTSAATAFNGLVISGTGTNLLLEIIVSSNDGGVEYAFDNVTINGDAVSAVPEPSALALVMLSGAAVAFRRRRA